MVISFFDINDDSGGRVSLAQFVGTSSDFIPPTPSERTQAGGLKPYCSGTNVHWTFSNGHRDRSRGHGRPRHPNSGYQEHC